MSSSNQNPPSVFQPAQPLSLPSTLQPHTPAIQGPVHPQPNIQGSLLHAATTTNVLPAHQQGLSSFSTDALVPNLPRAAGPSSVPACPPAPRLPSAQLVTAARRPNPYVNPRHKIKHRNRTPAHAAYASHTLRLADALETRSAFRDRVTATTTTFPYPFTPYSRVAKAEAEAAAANNPTPPPAAAGNAEVYAIPNSWYLDAIRESFDFNTDPPTPLAEDSILCGACLHPLHHQSVLPSRCQNPPCRLINLGSDWAANERFRQAMG